jgi:hypothetical protein
MTDDNQSNRRAFLGGVGRGLALLVAGGAVVRSPHEAPRSDGLTPDRPRPNPSKARHDDLPPPVDPSVSQFLGTVGVGTSLGAWTVAQVHGVFRGGLPIVLAHSDGRRAQVDLLAHDAGSPPGIAATTAGHLYLVNSGGGTRTTPPELERAIAQLARSLSGRSGLALGLVSQAERYRRHPGGIFVVPA